MLVVLALGLTGLDTSLTQQQQFTDEVEAVRGQELLARGFPAGASAPAAVLVPRGEPVDAVRRALERPPQVASVGPPREGPPGTLLAVVLAGDPYAADTVGGVPALRAIASAAAAGALVGGPTRAGDDLREAADRDNVVVPPVALAVVLVILVVLLRSLAAPVLLLLTVVASNVAALGLGVLLSERVYGFPAIDPTLPLLGFIFLAALGIDYNIFLAARAREEAIERGPRAGILAALTATGAVITAAGIVLAATFATLAILPLVVLTQLGTVVALGVLIDTLLVRSVLVPGSPTTSAGGSGGRRGSRARTGERPRVARTTYALPAGGRARSDPARRTVSRVPADGCQRQYVGTAPPPSGRPLRRGPGGIAWTSLAGGRPRGGGLRGRGAGASRPARRAPAAGGRRPPSAAGPAPPVPGAGGAAPGRSRRSARPAAPASSPSSGGGRRAGSFGGIWGYNGITPGPTVQRAAGPQDRHAPDQLAARRPPAAALQRLDLDAPARLLLAAAVRRLRQRHHAARAVQGLPLPEHPGRADALVPRPRRPPSPPRTPTWAWPRSTSSTTTSSLSLPIPHGEYDVAADHQRRDVPAERAADLRRQQGESGIYGDVILVNGRPWPLMQVEPRKYRFRILNASVSRSYDLALDTGEPMTVIGTDGGLMPARRPRTRPGRHGRALRGRHRLLEVHARPARRAAQHWPKNNIDFDTRTRSCRSRSARRRLDTPNNEVPADLNPNPSVMGLTEADAVRTRKLALRAQQRQWTINGKTWEDVVNSDYAFVVANPGSDDVEIWELENRSGGWFHPVHIHLVDFKILDRNGRRRAATSAARRTSRTSARTRRSG